MYADPYLENRWQHIVVYSSIWLRGYCNVDGVVVHESIVPAGRAAWKFNKRGSNNPWGDCIGEIEDVRLYNPFPNRGGNQ